MNHSPFSRQQGIAAILILVMLGLSLTAAMLGGVHYLRSSQEQHTTLHAQTIAQARAWTAAEALRGYFEMLAQNDGEWNDFVDSLGALPATVNIDLDGVEAKLTAVDTNSETPLITAQFQAKAAQNTRAESTTVLETVYALTLQAYATAPTPGPRTGLRLNANLSYTGGGLSIVDGENMADFAVSGSLTVASASKAITSGCAKGDINYSGGGIEDGARLVSEGSITFNSMTEPKDLTLWAKNFTLNQYGGTYNSIRAGAFEAEVHSAHNIIGKVVTGGRLQSDDKVIPANTGIAVITLNDGTEYHLRLDTISIHDTTILTNDAATRITGSGNLPGALTFVYKGVQGGAITIQSATISEMWGNNIELIGWNSDINEMKAHGNITTLGFKIGHLLAGGNWIVGSSANPTLATPSQIAGQYYGDTSPTQLTTGVHDASPGLPGNPICEVGPDKVDIERYKDEANYIFYFEGNKPMLRVQNLKLSANNSPINEIFDLSNNDVTKLHGVPFFECGWGSNHCFRDGNTSPSKGWTLTGTNSLPPGILWFDGDVIFSGMTDNTSQFHNSVLATGNLDLTNSGGHKVLRAPNFSDPADICTDTFYPANLCDKSVSPPNFIIDSQGRRGLPLANSAVLVEGDIKAAGWTIHGNVSAGKGLKTSGAKVTIKGGLSIGGNSFSVLDVGSGGLTVDLAGITQDQVHHPDDDDNSGSNSGSEGGSADLLWGRYL